MTTFYSIFSMLLLFSYWLLIAGITVRILITKRTVPSAMAWLLVIYILPLLGIMTYALFGELRLGANRAKRAQQMWPSTAHWLSELKHVSHIFSKKYSAVAEPLFQLCENRQGVPAIRNNQLQLLTHGDETMNSLVNDIQLAKNNIEMVFYIWQQGGMVDHVAEALIAAAKRGVCCRLMLDSAGSINFFHSPYMTRFQTAGVIVVEALKVNLFRAFFRRMDLRQHRKIVLIDNHIAYTGSMNMVDARLFKQRAGVGQWIDLMARIEGPVAAMIGVIYACDWEMETEQRLLPSLDYDVMPFEEKNGHAVHVIPSGPGYPEEMIHQAFLTAVYSSRKRLVMTTPYFVPSDDLLHAICTAALRGVDVSLILPKKNDSFIVGWASRSFYTELLHAGVKIYQFEGGLLHTKSILVDNELSLVGTVNLDIRSLWLNFEITIVVDDEGFAEDLFYVQNDYIARSQMLILTEWQKRPVWQRFTERLFYFFSPLL